MSSSITFDPSIAGIYNAALYGGTPSRIAVPETTDEAVMLAASCLACVIEHALRRRYPPDRWEVMNHEQQEAARVQALFEVTELAAVALQLTAQLANGQYVMNGGRPVKLVAELDANDRLSHKILETVEVNGNGPA